MKTIDIMLFVWFTLTVLVLGICAGGAIQLYLVENNNTQIAPSYALEKNECVYSKGCCRSLYDKVFDNFWQEATKNTTFTIDGEPVEITDIQIFYRQGYYYPTSVYGNFEYIPAYGNITYYPLGIENSQTYQP
jgi:hypothetical protein